MTVLHPYFQLKGKKGRGKAESVVDGAVPDTEVFTEELHVGICIMQAFIFLKFHIYIYSNFNDMLTWYKYILRDIKSSLC